MVESKENRTMKQQLTAFLLSFFLGGFGADWFYLAQGSTAYIAVGVTKLLLCMWPLVLCCCICCSACFVGALRGAGVQERRTEIQRNFKYSAQNKCGNILGCLIYLLCMTVFIILFFGPLIWWIVDFVRILAGTFPDGNGQDLIPF